MNKIFNRIVTRVPEGRIKEALRRLTFPVLFMRLGAETVSVGPPGRELEIKRAHLPFFSERLGNREMEGYLKRYSPNEGAVVVNAGGYHGYFGTFLARVVGPSGKVIIFEPDPINAKLIRRNISLNGLQNTTLIPCGLWSSDTSLPLSTRGSSSRIVTNQAGGKTIVVRQLDKQLEEMGIKKVDFISMDIEGAEIEALRGATRTLANNPHMHLAIASYHVVDGEETSKRVEQILREHGFESETSFPRHLTTYAYPA